MKDFHLGNRINIPEHNTIMFRYIKECQFDEMIEKQGVFFTRADVFFDQNEGELSDINYLLMKQNRHNAQFLIDFFEERKKHVFINCWTSKDNEDDLMWEKFTGKSNGVAIKTKAELLRGEFICCPFRHKILVSHIKYFEDDNIFGRVNIFVLFMRKPKKYMIENEIRALCIIEETIEEKRILVKCNLNRFISEIIISPFADSEYICKIFDKLKNTPLLKKMRYSSLRYN